MSKNWRRVLRRSLVGIIGFGVLVGPWPARNKPYTTIEPFRDTVRRLDRISVPATRGPLRVGVAEVDLTPATPVPVAGFIDQVWQPYVAINSPCVARALTLQSGPVAVTILTADLLLIDATMTRRILARTGLPRDQIYFTASHTHSGPGGWGNHPLERLVAGTFDPDLADELVDRLTRVVQISRQRLTPAEVGFVQVAVPGLQENRIWRGTPTNDLFSAWVFRSTTRPGQPVLATLTSFGAHATIAHPKPSRLSGDYPAAFVEALRARGQAGMILFAAGTVGDASPIRPKAINQQASVRAYGEDLAARVAARLAAVEFHRDIDLANCGLVVDLPPVQVPFQSSALRFSPFAFWWVAPPRTFLHTVRVGPAVLVGFPGDLAGHLAARLECPIPVVATSFNGDYKGYLVTEDTFRERPCYETRWMSFFGADLGVMLIDLAHRSVLRVVSLRP